MRVIAGSAQGGFAGDGAAGLNARFNVLSSIRGNGTTFFVADTFNHRIRTLSLVVPSTLAPMSGNDQSAAVNTALANPLVVQVRLADGTPVPGVPVTFAASAGGLDVATPVLTGADGTASARLTLPPGVGPVTVTAAVEGLPPVTFTATALPAP